MTTDHLDALDARILVLCDPELSFPFLRFFLRFFRSSSHPLLLFSPPFYAHLPVVTPAMGFDF